jgi:hypothetical protein
MYRVGALCTLWVAALVVSLLQDCLAQNEASPTQPSPPATPVPPAGLGLAILVPSVALAKVGERLPQVVVQVTGLDENQTKISLPSRRRLTNGVAEVSFRTSADTGLANVIVRSGAQADSVQIHIVEPVGTR